MLKNEESSLIHEFSTFKLVDNPVNLNFPEIVPTDPPKREVTTTKIVERLFNRLEEVSVSADIVQKEFPRIFERIEVCWCSNELNSYLHKLIVDERGDRDGFPKHVLEALLILARANLAELVKDGKVIDRYKNNPWITFSYK